VLTFGTCFFVHVEGLEPALNMTLLLESVLNPQLLVLASCLELLVSNVRSFSNRPKDARLVIVG